MAGEIFLRENGEPYMINTNEVLIKEYIAPVIPYEEVVLVFSGVTTENARTIFELNIPHFDKTSGITFEVYGSGTDDDGGIFNETCGKKGGWGGNYMKSVYTGGTFNGSTYDYNSDYDTFYVDIWGQLMHILSVPVYDYTLWNYNRVTTTLIPYKNAIQGGIFTGYTNSEFDLCGARTGYRDNNIEYTLLTSIDKSYIGGEGGEGFTDLYYHGYMQVVGGGGGAGENGNNGGNVSGSGKGGDGLSNSISGSVVYYGGGGGGGEVNGSYPGDGGLGGGGSAVANQPGGNGTHGLGGGGAGGSYPDYDDGGSGGSGIVIIRYLTP